MKKSISKKRREPHPDDAAHLQCAEGILRKHRSAGAKKFPCNHGPERLPKGGWVATGEPGAVTCIDSSPQWLRSG
jgi:hypothetical protein